MSSNPPTASAVGSSRSSPVWIPIESDPDIMTEYLRLMALTNHYLIDVPAIDYADCEVMGIFDGHNVKAFIFLYEVNVQSEANQPVQEVPPELFHLKQLIHNSCGSVALFHAYLNTVDSEKFNQSSIIAQYYKETAKENSAKRGEVFAGSQQISQLHQQIACCGQTRVPSEEELSKVNKHFVAIVPHRGMLYKLDGRCGGPVSLGPLQDGANFKQQALQGIKALIERDPDNFNFAVLAFCE